MPTFTDYSVTTREELKDWILIMLGEPLITVELSNEQLDACINKTLEVFTKYSQITENEDYLALPLSSYVENVGLQLPTDVVGISDFNDDNATFSDGVNRLFSVPNALYNAGIWPFANNGGRNAEGWISYELAMQYIDLTKRMMGNGYQFFFNNRTKYLKLVPDPVKMNDTDGVIVVGVWRERTENELVGEEWVKDYSLALSKVLLGTVRKKFSGVALLGGGEVDTTIGDEGLTEKEKLEEDLRLSESGPYGFFVG